MFKVVTASHDENILQANLQKSPLFANYELHTQIGFNNISKAYNLTVNKLGSRVMYVHHDVFLPESFRNDLFKALGWLAFEETNWGVLGVAGVKLVDGKKQQVGNILDRGREWGAPLNEPQEVDTLDELLLITRGDLLFDEQFDLHFYGADICMQARLKGMKCFALPAYCHHNSGLPLGYRSDSFRRCEAAFRAKYIDHLPIATTCSLLI